MDINMGELDGIEATRIITTADPAVKVILVSTYALDDLPPLHTVARSPTSTRTNCRPARSGVFGQTAATPRLARCDSGGLTPDVLLRRKRERNRSRDRGSRPG